MKRILFVIALLLLLIPQYVFALRQTVGKLVVLVEPGGSNSTYYGLINDLNETISVKIRVEGDAKEFISVPTQLELPPEVFVPVNVTARVPENYDFSKGTNVTGYVFALIEGEPGQVTINVQTRKTVEVIVLGNKPEAPVLSQQSSSSLSGFLGFIQIPIIGFSFGLLIALVLFGTVIYFAKRQRR